MNHGYFAALGKGVFDLNDSKCSQVVVEAVYCIFMKKKQTIKTLKLSLV